MSDPRVFTTDDPDQTAAMVDYKERHAGFRALLAAFAAEVDPDGEGREVVALEGDRRGPFTVGLRPTDSDQHHPPVGWRVTVSSGHTVLVPVKRSKAGKALAARFDELRVPKPSLVGMPCIVVRDGRWHEPGYGLLDGRLYCKWSGDVSDEDLTSGRWGKPADLTMWRPVPLSEFYALVENLEGAA